VLGMIKLKVPFETVLKACGIEDKREEESEKKVQVKIKEKKKRKVSEDEDPSVLSQEIQGIRVALGGSTGTFRYTDNTILSGDFDHDLSGGAFGAFSVSYVRTNENNLFFGGGFSSVNVSGPKVMQTGGTYYSPTYGYFDVYVTVKSVQTTFLFGLIGYDVKISDDFSFQPNIRIGEISINTKWTEQVAWYSYLDDYYNYDKKISSFGFKIDLPIMFRLDENIGIGADLCLCGSVAEVLYSNGSSYKFTSLNLFNIMVDFYF